MNLLTTTIKRIVDVITDAADNASEIISIIILIDNIRAVCYNNYRKSEGAGVFPLPLNTICLKFRLTLEVKLLSCLAD